MLDYIRYQENLHFFSPGRLPFLWVAIAWPRRPRRHARREPIYPGGNTHFRLVTMDRRFMVYDVSLVGKKLRPRE